MRLLGRDQCHLCETARRVVRSVCEPMGQAWEEVDVDDDPNLQDQYGELVPVVLVDGIQIGYWRIDPERLRTALAPARQTRRRSLRHPLRGR